MFGAYILFRCLSTTSCYYCYYYYCYCYCYCYTYMLGHTCAVPPKNKTKKQNKKPDLARPAGIQFPCNKHQRFLFLIKVPTAPFHANPRAPAWLPTVPKVLPLMRRSISRGIYVLAINMKNIITNMQENIKA